MAAVHCVQGALKVEPPFSVSGWCAIEAHPGRRATVDILVDGKLAISMVAAQRFEGGGDGRNGFALRLPTALDGPTTRVVEARERDSGTVFGRTLLYADRLGQPIEDRLAALDRSVLRGAMAGFAPGGAAPLHAALRDLGSVLHDHAAGALRNERNRIRRRVPRLKLARVPQVSLILPPLPTRDESLQALTNIQPVCDALDAELLIGDDGSTQAASLLAEAVPGARSLRGPASLPGAFLNHLASQAIGEILCFFEPAGFAAPCELDPNDGDVQTGGRVSAALRGFQPTWRQGGARGLGLMLKAVSLREAGGFDPALQGIAALADVVLKCALLGARVTAWGSGVEL